MLLLETEMNHMASMIRLFERSTLAFLAVPTTTGLVLIPMSSTIPVHTRTRGVPSGILHFRQEEVILPHYVGNRGNYGKEKSVGSKEEKTNKWMVPGSWWCRGAQAPLAPL